MPRYRECMVSDAQVEAGQLAAILREHGLDPEKPYTTERAVTGRWARYRQRVPVPADQEQEAASYG